MSLQFRINGEVVGGCRSLHVKQSTDPFHNVGVAGGSAQKIRFNRVDLFRKFADSFHGHAPMQFEFESNNSIWKATRSWVANYNYYMIEDQNAVIIEELDFQCECIEHISKKDIAIKKETKSIIAEIDASSPEHQELINKFASALSNYMEKKK